MKGAVLDGKHLPLIIHWNSDHYVILEQVNERQAVVVDPSLGRRVVRKPEFDKCFSGVAITMRFPPGAASVRPRGARASRFRRLLPVLGFLGWKELRGARTLGVLVLVLLTELAGLASPIFVSKAVGLASERVAHIVGPLVQLAMIFIVLNLIQGVALYVRGYLIGKMSSEMLLRWTELAYRHLLSLPLSFFLSRSVGGITSRLSSLRSLQTLLTGRFITAGLDVFVALVAMVVAWRYAPWAVMVIVVAMAVYAVARSVVNKKSAFYAEMSLVQLAQQDAELIDSVKGIATLKSGLNVEDRIARYRSMAGNAIEYQNLSQRYSVAIDALASVFVGAQRTIVVSLGVYFISNGSFNIALLAAMLTYLDILSNRVGRLIDTSNDTVNVVLHLSRLRDIAQADSEPVVSSLPSVGKAAGSPGGVTRLALKDLAFRHAGASRDVFESVSLSVHANERVAITGRSGEGKTTLLMVAAGLLNASAGTVEVDGQSIEEIGPERYRGRIGVVLQEDYLFPGSILENVSSFHLNPSREWVLECCRFAGIIDEVNALPMGILTRVADGGSNFSGGQRQRLCLARALYKKPQILILDESSSHLDSETERFINEQLGSLDVAILSVAHREETIRYADRVFKLEDGLLRPVRASSPRKVVELQGTV
ncbi:hypothetical protein A6R71_01260 [Xanthomonas translucens pv. arrhenatheri]|nr:hypothetical protein A6R71_01260 [Xanthomonas translucens pv. arrhenatheri]